MLCLNISDVTTITVKNIDHHCIIHNSKSEKINLLKDSVLENCGYIYIKKYCLKFQAIQDSFALYM